MKLLSAEQIKSLDQYTIQNEPITSLDLMERAASRCTEWLWFNYPNHIYAIFCGTGNNGGDGLAIARQLAMREIDVELYIAGKASDGSPDFLENLKKLKEQDRCHAYYLEEESHLVTINPERIVVDALFGTGLSRPIEGWRAELVANINELPNTKVAIDVPSGLFIDELSVTNHATIKADHTITFQIPKLAFLFRETEEYVGKFHVLNIGLDAEFHESQKSHFHFIQKKELSPWIKLPTTFSHKGTRGHLLTIAGSRGMMGAAQLCAQAALKSGAGLLSAHVPLFGAPIMQSAVPEAMCQIDKEDAIISKVQIPEKATAICVGPGLGQDSKSAKMLTALLTESTLPMVIDADALNIISDTPELLSKLGEQHVLTPHPGEFDRLFGAHDNSFDQLRTLQMKSQELKTTIILKGAYTRVALPDGTIWFNSTGNPGMGKGGSGDILSGIISALLSQGYDTTQSSILGVFIHGLAGDKARESEGLFGMTATSILHKISHAFQEVKKTSR